MDVCNSGEQTINETWVREKEIGCDVAVVSSVKLIELVVLYS